MKRIVYVFMAVVIAGLAGGLCSDSPGADPAMASQPLSAPAGTPATSSADAQARVDLAAGERGLIELHVRGDDIRQTLSLLNTQNKTNIICRKEVQGAVTVDLYGVTFNEALEAVLKSAGGYVFVRRGNFIEVMTAKQLEEEQAASRQTVVKMFMLNYLTAADAKVLIAPLLSDKGSISITPAAEIGIAASKDKTGTNSLAGGDVLVVRDYPENIEKVTQLVSQMDQRPPQVLIEAVLMVATLDEDNSLGIDFNVLAGVDFQTMGGSTTDLTKMSVAGLSSGQLDKTRATFRTDFNSVIPAGGLSIGLITNNVAMFIRAMENITDVAVMANPKLLIMNKQRGEVMVGNRDGYVTTTFTETTAAQQVQFLETGTKLVVRPFISSDGYVRLEIHPEDSTGGINAQSLPYEQTTEATSNVLVKDGHTIVIGGLFREQTKDARGQVPFLGNLPYVGNLFRRRMDNTKREEVIILVTPHIIRQSPDEISSEQLKDDAQRFRLGLRQGLMCTGRERLATAHMQWAREHMSAGHYKKALWDVDMALSMEPRMEEALRLKERLTKQAIWATESNYSSIEWALQRMITQELGLPLEKVTIPGKPLDALQLEEEIRDALGIGNRAELPLPGPRKVVPESVWEKRIPTSQSVTSPAAGKSKSEQK